MSIGTWNALLVVALLIVLSGGGYLLYQNHVDKQTRIEQQPPSPIEKEEEEKQARLQEFENFLNQMLDEVYEEAQSYKKNRAVLTQLTQVSNLEKPEYIEENARLAESTVMSLQLQMDDIMNIFEQADDHARKLIDQFEGDARETVLQTWLDVRNKNTNRYISFFKTERNILMAELQLIQFYAEHREELSIDSKNERVLFEDVTLQEQEAMLRGEIMQLKAEQKDILKSHKEKHSHSD